MRIWIPIALLVVAISGCSSKSDYPFDKPGTWHLDEAHSANDANLRAMLVNPGDLVVGQGESDSLGAEAAPPIKRLFTGHRTPLPSDGISPIENSGASQAPAPAPSPTGGGNGQ